MLGYLRISELPLGIIWMKIYSQNSWYKMHLSRQWDCWSLRCLRCSWSIACWRSNYLASIDCAKTIARRDEKHLSFVFWCNLYQRFDSSCPLHPVPTQCQKIIETMHVLSNLLIWARPNSKSQMLLISSCSCLCPIHWSRVLSRN